jgi:hypothetical protein
MIVLSCLVAACAPSAAELVPDPGGGIGARVTGCPVSDCGPVLERARLQLDASAPGHAAIVRERLGERICGADGQALCAISGPVGLASEFVVVLDLADGGRVFQQVLCFADDHRWDGAIPWNGAWC